VRRGARVEVDVEEDALRFRAGKMLQDFRVMASRPGPLAEGREALRVDPDDDDVRLDLVSERARARRSDDVLEGREHTADVRCEGRGEDERRGQRCAELESAPCHPCQSRPPSSPPRPPRSMSITSSRPPSPPRSTSSDTLMPPGSVMSAPRPASGP